MISTRKKKYDDITVYLMSELNFPYPPHEAAHFEDD